jgi:transglutaminase-like putative cysteine protease
MNKPVKPAEPPEESIPIRIICGLLALIAISCSFVFGKSPVPTVQFSPPDIAWFTASVWMCIGGCIFSYCYRDSLPKYLQKLLAIGAVGISVNLACELWLDNQHAAQFQFLYALVDALSATCVLSCFELRSRRDILSTSTFGLSLMALAGCSGRSIAFGACVFLYIVLGALLLCLIARSYAATMPGADTRLVSTTTGGRFIPALILSVLLLPCLSIAAFSFVPRLDSTADNLTIQIRSAVTTFIYQNAMKGAAINSLSQVNPNVKAKRRFPRQEQSSNAGFQPPLSSPRGRPDGGAPRSTTKPRSAGFQPASSSLGSRQDGSAPDTSTNGPGSAGLQPASSSPGSRQDGGGPDTPTTGPGSAGFQPASSSPGSRQDGGAPRSTTKQTGSSAKPSERAPGKPPAQKHEDKAAVKAQKGIAETSTPKMVRVPNGIKIPNYESESSVSMDKPMLMSDDLLFTMACNRQMYVKLCYYDTFDGRKWSRKDTRTIPFECSTRGVDFTSCPELAFSAAMPTVELTENFKIVNNIGTYLPTAGLPKLISLWQPINVDEYGNVSLPDPIPAGTNYTAVCNCPIYSLQQLRQCQSFADGNDAYVAPYLAVPKNQSDQVINLSNGLCDGGSNRFVEAENIVSYLRMNYTYSLQPVQADSTRTNLVDQFLLREKSGDCKAFASAFIILCRASGIPARYVSGFAPGDIDPMTGAACIRRKHGHGWAEIYMEPYGWIAFDPSPGGLLPARPEQKYYNYKEFKRAVTQSQGVNFAQGLETVLQLSGYALATLTAGLSLLALIMSAGVLRQLWDRLCAGLKQKHPATKLRNQVMNKLAKIGIRREVSDTGRDVMNKLEVALKDSQSFSSDEKKNLKRSVGEFFETYNAIVYGNEKEMERLKAIAISIEFQSRNKK